MKKEKTIIIPEKSLGDLIKQSFDLLKSNKPINFDNGELDNSPKMDDDEIHYGKDGKRIHMEPGPYEPDACDECGKEISGDRIFCKECERRLRKEEMKTRTGEIPMFKGERP